MHCPSRDEILSALVALLPTGRAWQTSEGGPEPFLDQAFNPAAFDPLAFSATYRKGTILYRFWRAIADVLDFVHARLCALRLEFWCATQSETHDLWMAEYGLPDPCDPFPDLCTKVAALGGSRCEYFNEIIARMGWSAECMDGSNSCGSVIGCARAGTAQPGSRKGTQLVIRVHLDESPAFGGGRSTPPLAGRLRAGMPLACPPDILPLRCLMDRIAPAHVAIEYQFV